MAHNIDHLFIRTGLRAGLACKSQEAGSHNTVTCGDAVCTYYGSNNTWNCGAGADRTSGTGWSGMKAELARRNGVGVEELKY